MSVSNTNSIAQYTGNGATVTFGLTASGNPIPYFAASDWSVNLFDTSAGANVSPQPVLGGAGTYDYAIATVATDPFTGELTGNLVFNTAPLGNHRVTATRAVPATSSNNFLDNSKFPAVSVNAQLDRSMMVAQQSATAVSRALQLPASDPVGTTVALPAASARANDFLAFDASGNLIASPGPSSQPISAPMLPVVQAASLATGRTAFGVGLAASPAYVIGDGSGNVTLDASFLRGYLAGLTLSNDGVTPNTKLDVAAGCCLDDTNATLVKFSAGVIDCTTVGANGLDAGSLANSTWYHVYAITKAAGASPAFLASTSASAPTLPSTYTLKRRIGSFKTDGAAHIASFVQDGDSFRWKQTNFDVNANNPGTAAASYTLSTPLGIRTQAQVEVGYFSTDTAGVALVSDLSANDEAASSTSGSAGNQATTGQYIVGPIGIMTSTASQVRGRLSASSAATNLIIRTLGWVDTRGRFA